MTPEQWARVKEVFNAALAEEASSRSAYVAEASAGDESVRAEVERLLDADLRSADFIERPAAAALLSGRVISHYEIGHLLGLDHTLDASSVMAPKVRVRSLSVADRETARLLYKLPAGSIR